MKKETSIAGLALVIVVFIVLAVPFLQSGTTTSQTGVKTFASYDEIKSFIEANTNVYNYYGGSYMALDSQKAMEVSTSSAPAAAGATSESSGDARSSDYSTTNIQVEGVDEADFVKSDGKYIYTVSGRSIVIVDAYPAQSASIVSQINVSGTPQEIYVSGNRLVVVGWMDYSSNSVSIPGIGIISPRYYQQGTFMNVYDITDRANPILTRNVTADGYYYNSRMIGDHVYFIINQNAYYSDTEPLMTPTMSVDGVAKTVAPTEIYYFDYPDSSYMFTNIISLNTQNDAEGISSKTYLMGYSENMFVSQSNIYIVHTKRLSEYDFYDRIVDEAIMPSMPINIQSKINEVRNSNISKYEKIRQINKVLQDYVVSLGVEEGANVLRNVQEKAQAVYEEISKELEKTVIHKIAIESGAIQYVTSGEVPGYTLNQFSMDEHNGYFRIATTTGNWRSENLNHMYVLDANLQTVGKLEDLASGERIYSARFMGDKAYMVTFRQVDPLFVIDLSSPSAPAVLGYLKIPGVSNYLHPYDETHLIGVGSDATDEGRVTGIKVSLFDVSDFANPREASKYTIGGENAYSYTDASYDHKAFLFDKDKRLLVIPISLTSYGSDYRDYSYWQGAYVFGIDSAEGISLRGKVTHMNETQNRTEYYYYDGNSQIRRSMYMDEILYTVSSSMIKMNSLDTIEELNSVKLPIETYGYYPYKDIAVAEAVSVR